MMNLIHKLVTFFTSPLTLTVLLIAVGLVLAWRQRKRPALIVLGVAIAWLWLWSSPTLSRPLGLPLERAYPPQRAEAAPAADLIVVLGGGMSGCPDELPYAEMNASADRVWHGARLFKAGKAPLVVMTGGEVDATTKPLLLDLGVPEEAIRSFSEAKNTEDEARHIKAFMASLERKTGKVLLVTSAWHMRRAEWLFRRAGLDVIPAPTDYEMTARFGNGWKASELFPQPNALYENCYLFKEHFSYWCYRLLK